MLLDFFFNLYLFFLISFNSSISLLINKSEVIEDEISGLIDKLKTEKQK